MRGRCSEGWTAAVTTVAATAAVIAFGVAVGNDGGQVAATAMLPAIAVWLDRRGRRAAGA